MSTPRHVVVFSHGFGVRKDSRGLFTDIAEAFYDSECVLFDYSEFDEAEQAVVIRPLSEQVSILRRKLADIMSMYPGDDIDLVAHSQGAVVAAMLAPVGIMRFVFIAPPLTLPRERTIERAKQNSGTVIDINGVSRLVGRSGNVVLVPALYWKEREEVNPLQLYNDLVADNDVTVVLADQDEILKESSPDTLAGAIDVIHLPGDHNFTGEARRGLVEAVKNILYK